MEEGGTGHDLRTAASLLKGAMMAIHMRFKSHLSATRTCLHLTMLGQPGFYSVYVLERLQLGSILGVSQWIMRDSISPTMPSSPLGVFLGTQAVESHRGWHGSARPQISNRT